MKTCELCTHRAGEWCNLHEKIIAHFAPEIYGYYMACEDYAE